MQRNKSSLRPVIVFFCLAFLFACSRQKAESVGKPEFVSLEKSVADAFQAKKSDIQVIGSGLVVKVLPDDTEGSRHQRFILKVSDSQTILIAHNIDLAPRLPELAVGDKVDFYGEYEWNEKGGVVHWTHHDPKRKHTDGWLRHKGKAYQ